MIQLTGGGYTAWILPERGGNCVRLEKGGVEALRTPEKLEDIAKGNPYLFGTPLLFPPNRISGARFTFEGREYIFPLNEPKTGCFLHGTMHETPFQIAKQSQSALLLRYTATKGAPYLSFPHAFTLTLSYTLSEDGLSQKTVFTNDSAENMPVALAFHTTFRLPFAPDGKPEDVRLTLDTSREFSRNMDTFLPDGGAASEYPGKEEMAEGSFVPTAHTISRLFAMGDRHEMLLTDAASGARVRYQASDAYGYWMVFNGGAKDFLCVEPQSWLSNCPNAPFPREEMGFAFIAPGESKAYETLMQIEA